MILLLLFLSVIPDPVTDARYPAPSPDGGDLVFCWRGDLWRTDTGCSEAIRCLTPGEGYDSYPAWSPDGSWIAFTSERTGNGDVYVMPSQGGVAERLTWNSSYDRVAGWSPGSDSVYFISSRDLADNWVYSVSLEGGTPVLALPVMTDGICSVPGGFVLERGFTPWWRRHYRGSASRNLWRGSGVHWDLLCASELDERWPMYSARESALFYVMEDASGNAALWSLRDGGEPSQVTFLEGDITFPGMSADGSTIIFEHRGDLCVARAPGWQVETLALEAAVDLPFPLEVQGIAGSVTSDYDVSRDGSMVALVSMGEVFVGSLENNHIEEVKRVTATPAAEGEPRWSPDGTMLVYSREEGGRVSLVLAQPDSWDAIDFTDADAYSEWVLPASSDVAERPVWSPSGSAVSYLDRDHMLHVIDIATGQDRLLCGTGDIIHHSWSPDERWLAFSVPVLAHREEVFLVSAFGGEPVNVSRHPNDDFEPVWSPDGRRLIFASRTDEGDYFLRQMWFTQEDFDADTDRREELLDEPLETVVIDWDGLQRRTETLCQVEGYYDFFGADSACTVFAFPAYDPDGNMDLWSVDWQGGSLTRLTWSDDNPSRITVPFGDTVFYLSYGMILRSVGASGGGSAMYGWSSPYSYDIVDMQYTKFDQAWRLLRDNFYDASMHGADWNAIREDYRDRAGNALLNADFNDVVRRMLGELSASHLGIYGPDDYRMTAWTGETGAIPDTRWQGPGIRVDSVLPRSPAALADSRLYEGDLILSVNGTPVGPGDNFYRPFAQMSGHEVRLEVRRGGDLIDVELEPVSAWNIWQLAYDEWIQRSRRRVAELSDDRVGYLHIRSMNQRAVDDFNRDLFAEGLDRAGMIIDVRGNGGGSTHDQILSRLDRESYAYSSDRWSSPSYEPLGVWQKPLVLLIDETCYSDAEIFPSGWKTLGLGPIVGAPTYGAVIGTNDVELMDGTGFRLPSSGWYTLDGRRLENSGVTPDVLVLALPADQALGRDSQLDMAVEVILRLIEEEED